MEPIILPPRLKKLASLVPQGSRLADVGTDHGWLPIALLEQGKICSAVATDIRPGPLERAVAHASERSVDRMECLLCDGLAGVKPYSVDCIVIAGMGGDSIVSILSAAPWAREGATLLLQPMSKPEILRRSLASLGLATVLETLAEDNHRIYPILVCRSGKPYPYTDTELYTGPAEYLKGDPLFSRKLDQLIRQMGEALSGVENAVGEEGTAKAEYLRSLIRSLIQLKGTLA